MVFFGGALGLVMIALWLFCIIDAITTPASSVRNLPKLAWVMIVILLVDIGSVAWLVAGRNWNERLSDRVQALSDQTGRTPSRAARPSAARRTRPVATNPDDDEEFIAGLRARAEEQRRRAQRSTEPQDTTDDPPTG